MSTEVLVTVVGAARRGEVCLDNTVPISALLSELTRHYGVAPNTSDVVLADDRGAVLDPSASLEQAGVTHGSRLMLHARQVVESRPGPADADVQACNPLDKTRRSLPVRHRSTHRLRRSLAAAVGRTDAERRLVASATQTTPSPGELTLPAAPGPVARWKRAWEDTDYLHRLDLAITRPQLSRCATVAVVSPKGGVGKTTTTALLGTLIAHLRRDLVVAVDANPDYGSLGRVLCPAHRFFVDDLAAYLDAAAPVPSLADLNARLGAGPHGLRVLPAPTDPSRMSQIGLEVYRDVIGRLKAYTGLLLLDCGTGLHEPAATAALAAADQIIVVSDAEPATASLVAEAICRIPLTAPLSLVVNKMPARGGRLDLSRLAETLPAVDHLVVIPADARAASALGVGAFRWEAVPMPWRRSVRELAAVLVGSWAGLGLQRSDVARSVEPEPPWPPTA
jgi:MinD-like ATPase involved in chromosome partitioning or flagellar assembly